MLTVYRPGWDIFYVVYRYWCCDSVLFMSIWLYYIDSPSGSCCSWFLSTDSSCRVGAQDTHPRLVQGLERRRCLSLKRWLPRFLSMHRDRCAIVLFPSHTFLRLRCGWRSVTESRRLCDKSSSVTESWMCRGTKERPEEEQFNRGALWQVHESGQSCRGEDQWTRQSRTAANSSPCATAIITSPESTVHIDYERLTQNDTGN